ncbi:ABC transporter permease [Clostridium sp. P21]|uniref:ABC transporter permease n=1 Tax=Clostridium muellerianum TaxID=2716538 RepID=A0A7Y0EH55_9CLOT|nr:ABC transporter permease [Clostridium muellerianum]NMM63042.1 ABC transporter permease [Clostridium muellerianum]
MMNVISSEFYKIFRSRIFHVVSVILLAMNVIAFVSILIERSTSLSTGTKHRMMETAISSYQESYSADFIFYMILIFVACMITAEYSGGNIRQMTCHGIARWKLVFGQYIAMSSAITIILLGFGILNLLSTIMLFQLGQVDAAAFIRMNIGMICMFWGTAGIGAFLSYLLKNEGITIIISILLVASSSFIVSLFTLITKNDAFKRYSLTNMRSTIVNLNSKPEDVVNYSIAFLLIGIVTIFASSLLFSKRDVD